MGWIFSKLMIGMIKLYRLTLSHVFAFFGVRCRHHPSCSKYGLQAIDLHGPWTGGWLSLSRVLRCHPFGSKGFDPVPPNNGPRGKFWQIWQLGDWSWAKRGVEQPSCDCNSYAPNQETDSIER